MTRIEIDGPAWAFPWTRLALSELPADITTATPPQVDEVIRTVTIDKGHNLDGIRRHIDALHTALGHRRDDELIGTGRNRERRFFWVDVTGAEVRPGATEAEARRIGNPIPAVAEPLAGIDAIRATDGEIDGILDRCKAEYNRRPWARYYRVANTGGHVHTSTACRDTYPTTLWNWPTALSGATHAQVVEYARALTCLRCFPEHRDAIADARPPWHSMFETREQTADREAREQEKADKLAAKIAKGVTPDGSPLEVRFDGRTNEIKTERAAELRYVDCRWDTVRTERLITAQRLRDAVGGAKYLERLEAERAEYQAAAQTLLEALAWKRGLPVAEVADSLAERVSKKIQRETY